MATADPRTTSNPKKTTRARSIRFAVKLVPLSARSTACPVVLPKRVHLALGGDKARIPIAGTADGKPFRTSAMPMRGCHCFVFNAALKQATGKGPGDRVTFVVARDEAPRVVTPPADLARALAAKKSARDAFAKLSYTHQREYVQWVLDAKKEETRARRVARAVEMIAAGRKEPRS